MEGFFPTAFSRLLVIIVHHLHMYYVSYLFRCLIPWFEALVRSHHSHPCSRTWCLPDESWGLVHRLVKLIRYHFLLDGSISCIELDLTFIVCFCFLVLLILALLPFISFPLISPCFRFGWLHVILLWQPPVRRFVISLTTLFTCLWFLFDFLQSSLFIWASFNSACLRLCLFVALFPSF